MSETHINTETYKQALNSSVNIVGNEISDIYIKATNEVLLLLAIKQINLAFSQSEKKVTDLQQRTRDCYRNGSTGRKKVNVIHTRMLDNRLIFFLAY